MFGTKKVVTPRPLGEILSEIDEKANEVQTRVDFDLKTKEENEAEIERLAKRNVQLDEDATRGNRIIAKIRAFIE